MMLVTLSRCRSDSGPRIPSRRISACVMIAVSGVRRSCEMFARNCVLSASRDCSSAVTCAASFSASSSCATRCSAVVVESTGTMAELYRDYSARCHPLRGHGFVFDRVLELLSPQQRPVTATGGDEIRMFALLDDPPIVQHDDPACVPDGADAMRRDDGGSPLERFAQTAEDVRFGVRIDGRQCV